MILDALDLKTAVIVADEVHRFGAENYRKALPQKSILE